MHNHVRLMGTYKLMYVPQRSSPKDYLNGTDSAELIRILQAPVIGIRVGWHLKIRFS